MCRAYMSCNNILEGHMGFSIQISMLSGRELHVKRAVLRIRIKLVQIRNLPCRPRKCQQQLNLICFLQYLQTLRIQALSYTFCDYYLICCIP